MRWVAVATHSGQVVSRLAACLSALLAALALLPSEAVAGARWRETDQVFAANSSPRGERTFARNEEVLRLPLLWEQATVLDQSVNFAVGAEIGELSAGTVLPLVKFSAAGDGSDMVEIFCTPRRPGERSLEGGIMGAMFGGVATRALARSLTDTQRCLQDTDGDGSFDRTLIVGEGDNDFVIGPALDPFPYQVRSYVPISESDDAVVITLRSVRRSGVRFQFDIIQLGEPRNFDSATDGTYGTVRDKSMSVPPSEGIWQIYGVDLRYVASDASAARLTLDFPANVDAERYPSIPDRWTQLITYLPH